MFYKIIPKGIIPLGIIFAFQCKLSLFSGLSCLQIVVEFLQVSLGLYE